MMLSHYGTQLELKTVDVPQRIIAGYAAIHHNLDRVGDIIDPEASVKAVARLRRPSDVGVFVGHDSTRLPIGIPQKIEATDRGLYTETYILKGPEGDNLLAVAADLHAHGLCLGQSIGYQTKASKPDRHNGKLIRRLKDYALSEYSYAASQAIANPEALTIGVKARVKAAGMDDDTYSLVEQAGRFHIMAADGTSLIDFATRVEANAALAALKADAAEDSDEEAMEDGPMSMSGDKTVLSTTDTNTLPDSAFLFVAPGGAKDEENKTVPRGLRLFPYRDAGGAIDLPHLRDAIGRISQSNADGLDDQRKSSLQARARKLLEDATSGKASSVADEWKSGAPLALWGLGAQLQDLAESLVEEHKAMALLGEETKDGYRIRPEMRAKLIALTGQLTKTVEWSEVIDRNEDGLAHLALIRRELDLLTI